MELKKAADAWKRERDRRDEFWSQADAQLREAERYHGQWDYCRGMKDVPAEHQAAHVRMVACLRGVYLAHLRLAREYAASAGDDVSGVEIPSDG